MKRNYESRKPFSPVTGELYENAGGGRYRCLRADHTEASFINVASGWLLRAHGCGIYQDGKIDWDYSTGGCFAEVPA
jgi:hypothetical protein